MIVANILAPLTHVEEWTLERLHSLGLGWGLAIVALTVLVRMSTLPLVVRQFRSQREMKLHAPELKRIQAEHKGDKERLQKETMAYYKEHGINPLASLGPLIVQIPIFISLYLLLRGDASSGLFGSSSFLFIPDLTSQPHGAALVALISMYLCSQLATSAIATRTMQSSHRGIAMMLPLLFAGVIARFPAGLAIYSMTTSLWSLGQQVSFWRLSPSGAGVGAAGLIEELEAADAAEGGEEGSGGSASEQASASEGRPESAPEPVAALAAAGPSHSRSKKRKRSRSRR